MLVAASGILCYSTFLWRFAAINDGTNDGVPPYHNEDSNLRHPDDPVCAINDADSCAQRTRHFTWHNTQRAGDIGNNQAAAKHYVVRREMSTCRYDTPSVGTSALIKLPHYCDERRRAMPRFEWSFFFSMMLIYFT